VESPFIDDAEGFVKKKPKVFYLSTKLRACFPVENILTTQMFALPGMTRLRANVPRARATALVLPRGCLGHLSARLQRFEVRPLRERGRRRSGFTLLELLIVVGIIGNSDTRAVRVFIIPVGQESPFVIGQVL
jgi:prepilin-type N-terminal cleavage/methylation domain-containing protein